MLKEQKNNNINFTTTSYSKLEEVNSEQIYNQLAEYTRIARYAQYVQESGRRETWEEQVDRVFKMHKVKFYKYWSEPEFQKYFKFAKKMVLDKKVLGSQRALQFGGPAILNKNARIYNCSATYIDRPRVFQEIMFSLLCGEGMGFSVQFHHIAKLPIVTKINKNDPVIFQIPDSIEGWSDAVGVLLSSYFTIQQPFPYFFGRNIKFDFSKIRKKGSYISHMGNKAPGPDGLKQSLEKIRIILDRRSPTGSLRPIDCYDILMHCSDAVLSGGIRRAATLALFSLEDEDMIKAKTGNWYIDNPQRARSNNSVLLVRSKIDKEKYMKLIESVKQFGEPGLIFADNTETLYNPCVPGDTWVLTKKGSFQVKNLIGKPFIAIVDGKEYKSKGFFKTGHKKIYKIKTLEGFEISATDNHKIMTADKKWLELKDLEVEDKILLHDHSQRKIIIDRDCKDFYKGWILGSLYGDGTFYYKKKEGNTSKAYTESGSRAYLCYWGESRFKMRDIANSYLKKLEFLSGHSHGGYESGQKFCGPSGKFVIQNAALFKFARKYIEKNKKLTHEVENESLIFQAAFVRGYFDADGSVQGTQKKGVSVRLTSNNIDTLKIVQKMCLRLGIYGKIYKNRRPDGEYMLPKNDGSGGSKLFYCKAVHELIITKSSIKRFSDIIGFHDQDKQNKLHEILSSYKRRPSGSRYVGTIEQIKFEKECDVYDCTVEDVHAFDANGFYVHNCVEISLRGYDSSGKSGIQKCNLSEINMSVVATAEDFYNACRAASILGTFQAAYTDFKYLGSVTKSIVEKEALIGVSMTGMMDSPKIAFNKEILEKGAQLVKEVNKKVAHIIEINAAARTTCVKPAGSTSCILNTCSGIHPHHAKRYFRRVQSNKLEKPLDFFKKYNPNAVEESVWSAGRTDEVVTFLQKAKPGALVKNNVSALDLLEKVKFVQKHWVVQGKDEKLCVDKTLNHNVSNTITIKPDEWESTAEFIYENRQYFAGISMLPSSGDMTYPQAPFQEVLDQNEIVDKYGAGALFSSGLIVHAHNAFDGNLYKACSALIGQGEDLKLPAFDVHDANISFIKFDKIYKKIRWISQANKFSLRHFNGDKLKMTYCLKSVDAWHKWCNLKRTYKNVQWDKFKEDQDNTKHTEILACSGNACEVISF